jgi:AraC-like DNA-binding protein
MAHVAVTVLRSESAESVFEMAVGRPATALAPLATRYAGYVERGAIPVGRREVPSGGVTVIVSLGPSIRVATPHFEEAASVSSFVAGLHDGPAFTEHDGIQEGVQVDLTPIGAYALFGIPTAELTNRVVALDELLGREFERLLDRLIGASEWGQRFRVLDEALSAAAANGPRPAPEVAWLWHELARRAGEGSIGVLAEEVGWSRRHLAARFKREIGLGPKALARVLRFRRAVRRLRDAPAVGTLAAVAAECGYYDQAHFTREFRALAGCSPREFLTADR